MSEADTTRTKRSEQVTSAATSAGLDDDGLGRNGFATDGPVTNGFNGQDRSRELVLSVYQQRREAIVRRIYGRLSSSHRFVAWADAEDAYAELFPRALDGFDVEKASAAHDDIESAAESYLVKAGVNRAIDAYRSERGWSQADVSNGGGKREIPTDPQDLVNTPDATVDTIELRGQLQALFAESMELPEKDRQIFWSHHFKGQKLREIAAERDVSERWIKKRVALVRTRLSAVHARPALVPVFFYQLYWRLRDALTPVTNLATQHEPVSAGVAKAVAVGVAVAVSVASAPTIYKQVHKPHRTQTQVAAPTAADGGSAGSFGVPSAVPSAGQRRMDSSDARSRRARQDRIRAAHRRKARRAQRDNSRSAGPAPATGAPVTEPVGQEPSQPSAPSRRQQSYSATGQSDVGALDP